ncbi:MAG: ribose 5-phosphate isomerase B [Bacilli bacterium]
MIIGIGSDHGGFLLKTEVIKCLKAQGHEVIDEGCYDTNSVDYPKYAYTVAQDIISKKCEAGVLICTTGEGMAISANKVKGIRAALVTNSDQALYARLHNDANIICMGAKYTTPDDACTYVTRFLSTKFDGGRHLRRVDLIKDIEEKEN